MYYKVKEGTETFDKLELIWSKINECNSKALNLVEELGFEKFGKSKNNVGGGISCIQSNVKPEGFKTVGKKNQNLYYPKVKNKVVLEKIKALPTVSYSEYNETIGFESQYSGFTHYRYFGSKKVKGFYLIDIDDNCKYTPKKDMIEIVSSEYKRLNLNI